MMWDTGGCVPLTMQFDSKRSQEGPRRQDLSRKGRRGHEVVGREASRSRPGLLRFLNIQAAFTLSEKV